MILLDHFRVQRLWRGNKGRHPRELELPQLTWDGEALSSAPIAGDRAGVGVEGYKIVLEAK